MKWLLYIQYFLFFSTRKKIAKHAIFPLLIWNYPIAKSTRKHFLRWKDHFFGLANTPQPKWNSATPLWCRAWVPWNNDEYSGLLNMGVLLWVYSFFDKHTIKALPFLPLYRKKVIFDDLQHGMSKRAPFLFVQHVSKRLGMGTLKKLPSQEAFQLKPSFHKEM